MEWNDTVWRWVKWVIIAFIIGVVLSTFVWPRLDDDTLGWIGAQIIHFGIAFVVVNVIIWANRFWGDVRVELDRQQTDVDIIDEDEFIDSQEEGM